MEETKKTATQAIDGIRGAAARQGIAAKAASEANGRLTRATEALWREILTAMRDHGAVIEKMGMAACAA
jgi:hypothetical protein